MPCANHSAHDVYEKSHLLVQADIHCQPRYIKKRAKEGTNQESIKIERNESANIKVV